MTLDGGLNRQNRKALKVPSKIHSTEPPPGFPSAICSHFLWFACPTLTQMPYQRINPRLLTRGKGTGKTCSAWAICSTDISDLDALSETAV